MKKVDNTLSLFDISNESALDIIKNKEAFKNIYVETERLPKPFYGNIATVKAIVIGPDPSIMLKHNFKYVYGLETPNNKYFVNHKANLRSVGIDLDNIYVQNLVQNYSNKNNDRNPVWYEMAEIWKPTLKQELDTLFSPKIPVFFTSVRVLQSLMPEKINKMNVVSFYQEGKFIAAYKNYLKRTLIPLQTSQFYHKYDLFTKNVKRLLGTS